MTLDPHSGVPLHKQLAAALRARIASGEWPPGRLLPAVARLAYEYGVGKMTVQTAINALRAEGLVNVQRGHGTRVREPVEPERVIAESGSVVTTRMPTPQERAVLGVPDGVPMIVVTGPDGISDAYPGDRTEVQIP